MLRADQRRWRSLKRWVFAILLILSLMRFINLDTKPFWYDEVYTALRLSGYTKVDIFQQVGAEQKIFGDLQAFQCPSSDRNLGNVLNGLITDDIHPPLYFTVLYYWVKLVGCSVSHLRLFSAILSLLLIPISYIFIFEIFKSESIALLTTILMTNSPIFLIYIQESRHYILLILLALASSVCLLRYLDHKSSKFLIAYNLLSTAGLYCHTLYYLVIIGQVNYSFLNNAQKQKSDKFFFRSSLIKNTFQFNKNLLIAILFSFSLFLIWIARVIYMQGLQISVGADYTWKSFSTKILWQRIALNFTSLITDFESPLKSEILTRNSVDFSLLNLDFYYILSIIFVCLIFLYSVWYTIQHSDRSRVFILGWLSLPSILFLIKDIVLGGSASSIIRYQLLSVFGLYACLSFCLVSLCKKTSITWIKTTIISLTVLLLQMQTSSNLHYLNASTWWSKYGDYKLQEFADSVNQSPHPIILGEANYREMVNLLKLSYVLDPSVPFQLVDKENFSENSLHSYNIFWVPQI